MLDRGGRLSQIHDALADLFEDGGRSVLDEGGLGSTWVSALSSVPPEVLDVAVERDRAFHQLVALRNFWSAQRDLQPAIALTRGLLRLRIARFGHGDPDTLMELGALGALAQRAGEFEEGGQLLQKAFKAMREVADADDLRLAVVAGNLARHWIHANEMARAESALALAYDIRKRVAPGSEAMAAAQLGEVKSRRGDPAGALPLLKEAWMAIRADRGDDHAQTMGRAQAYSLTLIKLDRHSEAVMPLRQVYAWAKKRGKTDLRALAAFHLGVALDQTGAREEGWRHVEEAIRSTREMCDGEGLPHLNLASRLSTYANMQLRKGRVGEAEGLLLEALESERRLFGDSSVEVASRYATLGYFFARQGRTAEAMGWLDPAASLMRSAVGDDHPKTRVVVDYQAGMLIAQVERAAAQRQRDLARELVMRAWTLAGPVLGFKSQKVRRIRELAEQLGFRLG
jgi:tetratricopeptide (TPR) repeat protein